MLLAHSRGGDGLTQAATLDCLRLWIRPGMTAADVDKLLTGLNIPHVWMSPSGAAEYRDDRTDQVYRLVTWPETDGTFVATATIRQTQWSLFGSEDVDLRVTVEDDRVSEVQFH